MERVRRRWWTAAVSLAAALVVLGALLTALFQVVMLAAPGYREDLADYVSRAAGQPVDIGGVGLGWSGIAPRLDLTDITLYGEDGHTPALSAERLRLGFGFRRLTRGDTTPQRVELSGLELFAQIDAAGKFSLRGLDTSGMPATATQDWLRQLGRFHSVRLSRCELQLDDARLTGPKPRFRLIDAELEFEDGQGSATAELALPPSIGSRVQLDASVAGDLEKPETWNGRWSAAVEQLAGLPWLDARLAKGASVGFRDTELNLEGALEGGRLGVIDARLDAGAALGRKGKREASLRDIRANARIQPLADGFSVDIQRLLISGVDGPWPESQARLRYTHADSEHPEASSARAPGVDAQAGYLHLADLAPWLALAPDESLAADPRLAQLSGALRGLVLRWQRGAADDTAPRYSLRADVQNLAVRAPAAQPGFEGLSGEFSASENGGRFQLRDAPFQLRMPALFTQPVGFENLAGELDWARTREGWDLRIQRLAWQLDGSRGQGGMELKIPREREASPVIRLDARFSAADVTRFKPYMPRFWSQPLHDWLSRAVVAGRIPNGRLRLEGALSDFPWVDKPGTFALDLDAADAELAFAPNWPSAEKLSAHLEFRGNTLAVTADAGTISGTRVEQVQALIPDLRHDARLAITGEVQGEAARFYDFLRASPLAPRVSGLLNRTRASGDAVVAVNLDIPLHHVNETLVNGEVRLRGVQLDVEALPEPVEDIRGELAFSNTSVSAQGLEGRLMQTPVSANLSTREDGAQVLDGSFEFVPDASGAGLSSFLPGFLRSELEGRSRWQAQVMLSGRESGQVRLRSDLVGLASRLPPPGQKAAEEAWPLAVEIGSERNFPLRISIEMAERLGLDLAFTRDGAQAPLFLQRAKVRAGAGAPPRAEDDGIHVSGTLAELDPLRWVSALRSPGAGAAAVAGGGDAPVLPLYADLNLGQLRLEGQTVEGVRVTHAPAPGGWQTRVSGNGAQGELSFREGEDGGALTGRFARVQLAARRKTDERVTPVEPEPQPARSPNDPARLPRLDFEIGELRAGEAELGRLELRTTRIDGGQRLERFATTGEGGRIEGRGEWRRRNGRSSAELQLKLESNAVDELLKAFGYAPNLDARKSRFEAQLAWPEAAPTAANGIALAQAQGQLKVDLEKGALRAVEPGAGRVLGLINFWALPRRLTLDFRDVVSGGLSVDRIRGSFEIGRGVAVTDNLDIESPSLRMEVRGRVGLAARDYDQHVTVYPDVSSGVTLGALLLGGPAAGVLALIAQEVLEQPLDQVGQLSYHLTGKWDDPEVVRTSGGDKAANSETQPR